MLLSYYIVPENKKFKYLKRKPNTNNITTKLETEIKFNGYALPLTMDITKPQSFACYAALPALASLTRSVTRLKGGVADKGRGRVACAEENIL